MNLAEYKERFLSKYNKAFFFDGTPTTLVDYYCATVSPSIDIYENDVYGRVEQANINSFLTKELDRYVCRIVDKPDMEVGANIFLRRYAIYLLNDNDELFGEKEKPLIPVLLKKSESSIKDRILECVATLGFPKDEAQDFIIENADSLVVLVQNDIGLSLNDVLQIPYLFEGKRLKTLAVSNEHYCDSLGYRWTFSRKFDNLPYTHNCNYCYWLSDHIINTYFKCKGEKISFRDLPEHSFSGDEFIPSICCFSFAISSARNRIKSRIVNIYEDAKAFVEEKLLSFCKHEYSKLNVPQWIIQKDLECYLSDYVLANIFTKQQGKTIQNFYDSVPNNGWAPIGYLKDSFIFNNGVLNKKNLKLLMTDYFNFFNQFEMPITNFFSKGPELQFIYWIYYATIYIDLKKSASFIDYLNALGSDGLFIPIMSVILIEKCYATLPTQDAERQVRKIINSFLDCKESQLERNQNKKTSFWGEEYDYEKAYHYLISEFASYFAGSFSTDYPSFIDKFDSKIRIMIEEVNSKFLSDGVSEEIEKFLETL